jgi:transcription-repair coupling factor (superfamily II helicase)
MRAKFQPLARTAGGDLTKSRIYKDMGGGVYDAHRYYLPLFFEETATVFDGKMPRWVLHGDLEPAFQRFWQDARTATGWLAISPALPSVAVLSAEQFDSRVSRWRCAARLKTLPTTRRSKAQ